MVENKNSIVFFILIILLQLFVVNGCAANESLLRYSLDSRQEYVNNHLELSLEIKQAILEGKIREGMTKEDVKIVWGEPDEIEYPSQDKNSSWYTEEFDEEWYYKGHLFKMGTPSGSIFFKKGIVIEVQMRHWYDK